MKLNKVIRLTEQTISKKPHSEEEMIRIVTRDWRGISTILNPSEAVQLAAVCDNGFSIQFIKNPPETVQLAAVSRVGSAIKYIKNPSQLVLTTALKQKRFMRSEPYYEDFVREYFKDNQLLIKKWLRYRDTMRDQE
jgi:hypothetical protein